MTSRPDTLRRAFAALALGGGLGGCLIPQDDQLISELPVAANRPLRVIPGLSVPPQRETTAKFGTNCPRPTFSVKVDDPNPGDVIRAQWFIDPIERYIGGVPGNQGVSTAGSTVREVTAPSPFMTTLGTLTDGRKHRVEVVVTDGEFSFGDTPDPITMEPKPFLRVSRPSIRGANGEEIQVAAYRDDYVWLVEVDTLPCP